MQKTFNYIFLGVKYTHDSITKTLIYSNIFPNLMQKLMFLYIFIVVGLAITSSVLTIHSIIAQNETSDTNTTDTSETNMTDSFETNMTESGQISKRSG